MMAWLLEQVELMWSWDWGQKHTEVDALDFHVFGHTYSCVAVNQVCWELIPAKEGQFSRDEGKDKWVVTLRFNLCYRNRYRSVSPLRDRQPETWRKEGVEGRCWRCWENPVNEKFCGITSPRRQRWRLHSPAAPWRCCCWPPPRISWHQTFQIQYFHSMSKRRKLELLNNWGENQNSNFMDDD